MSELKKTSVDFNPPFWNQKPTYEVKNLNDTLILEMNILYINGYKILIKYYSEIVIYLQNGGEIAPLLRMRFNSDYSTKTFELITLETLLYFKHTVMNDYLNFVATDKRKGGAFNDALIKKYKTNILSNIELGKIIYEKGYGKVELLVQTVEVDNLRIIDF